MEDEARRVLDASVEKVSDEPLPGNLADAIASIFDPLGGVNLDIPPREPMREPPDFSGPEHDLDDHPRHERSV
ncbi:hypothetical protein [Chenggangzhangella methanolivorans]